MTFRTTRALGAVNTVALKDGSRVGHNTTDRFGLPEETEVDAAPLAASNGRFRRSTPLSLPFQRVLAWQQPIYPSGAVAFKAVVSATAIEGCSFRKGALAPGFTRGYRSPFPFAPSEELKT